MKWRPVDFVLMLVFFAFPLLVKTFPDIRLTSWRGLIGQASSLGMIVLFVWMLNTLRGYRRALEAANARRGSEDMLRRQA